MFDASTLSKEAKKVLKVWKFSAKTWEPMNTDRTADYDTEDEYVVIRAYNKHGESVDITNKDMALYEMIYR